LKDIVSVKGSRSHDEDSPVISPIRKSMFTKDESDYEITENIISLKAMKKREQRSKKEKHFK